LVSSKAEIFSLRQKFLFWGRSILSPAEDFFFGQKFFLSGRSTSSGAEVSILGQKNSSSGRSSYFPAEGAQLPFSLPAIVVSVLGLLMKKIGYHKNFSGAVESAASVGGQILPPIMGAAAFIMAENLGIPYTTIILAGIIPALLFYIGILLQVHIRASNLGLKGLNRDELPSVTGVLKKRSEERRVGKEYRTKKGGYDYNENERRNM